MVIYLLSSLKLHFHSMAISGADLLELTVYIHMAL